ncbi:ferritin-like domain-containing protein [Thalassobaculum sp.]|uniref:YciE/YciF ferroxidase family protein n=1 Tax=Thalassobaculum sp. TaxID=2022740 RepID=UPI003B5A715D
MRPDDLKSLYLMELQEACSFEAQFATSLPDLAEKAGNDRLREFLSADRSAALIRGERVWGLLEVHDIAADTHTDGSMQAILREAGDWAATIPNPTVRDAALIASIQRILHYGMAVYGSLAGWAKELNLADTEALSDTLEEAKRADAQLTAIAEEIVNRAAA